MSAAPTQPAVAYDFISCDIETAAAKTGFSPTTVKDAMRAGQLVGHYVGRKPVIRAVDLDAWVASLPEENVRRPRRN